MFSFVVFIFILFFQLGQNRDSPQTRLPLDCLTSPGLAVAILQADGLYSVHAIPCLSLSLFNDGFRGYPVFFFSQGPTVQSITRQLILAVYRIFKVGYVRPCIAVPIDVVRGTPISRL